MWAFVWLFPMGELIKIVTQYMSTRKAWAQCWNPLWFLDERCGLGENYLCPFGTVQTSRSSSNCFSNFLPSQRIIYLIAPSKLT